MPIINHEVFWRLKMQNSLPIKYLANDMIPSVS